MKIGLDAKRAFLNRSGLGNYSRLIIDELAKQPSCEVVAYTPSRSDSYKPQNAQVVTPKGIYSLLPRTWRTKGIISDLKRDDIDVFHGLSNELPISLYGSKIKSVVTIHDLIFLRMPELYRAYDRAIYKRKVRSAVELADKVIAISQQTKDDLVEFFNISESRISLIYQDCDLQFRKQISEEEIKKTQQKYGLPSEYILSVGTIEERKNQLLTLKSAQEIGVSVVFIGKKTSYYKGLQKYVHQYKLQSKVFFPENVLFSDFPALYQGARVFMYPSLFEGFGIPILEALRSKVPVITSKGSCFEETGGANCLYIRNDVNEAVAALHTVLNQETTRTSMVESGLIHAQTFNVEKTIPQLVQLYSDLAR